MDNLSNVVGSEGFKVNVGIDTTSVLYLAIGVFFGIVGGGLILHLLTKNL